jgi:large subunit ribosomal protein L24
MSKLIKKGTNVKVITGNDKGRTGSVLKVIGDRVVVQGVNIRKKHKKRNSEVPTATITEMEASIHISNVCKFEESN